MKSKLTAQQRTFVTAYLADPTMNATAAYIKAYPKSSAKSAEAASCKLTRIHKVKSVIDKALAERAVTAEKQEIITKEYVLECMAKSLRVNGTEINDRDGNKKLTSDSGFNKAVELAARYHSMLVDTKVIKLDTDTAVLDILSERKQ